MNSESDARDNSSFAKQELQIDELCNAFEAAWKAGERPAIKASLSRVHPSARPMLLRELIAIEVFYRKQQGEAPGPEQWLQRFPDLERPWLISLLADDRCLERATPAPTAPLPLCQYR